MTKVVTCVNDIDAYFIEYVFKCYFHIFIHLVSYLRVFKVNFNFPNNSVNISVQFVQKLDYSEIPPFLESFLWFEFTDNLLFMPINFQAETT